MSTYYYLCCVNHMTQGPMVSGRSFPDRWWGCPDESNDHADFIRDHEDCKSDDRVSLVVLGENSVDGYVRWEGGSHE